MVRHSGGFAAGRWFRMRVFFVAGVADPGRGAEGLSERLFSMGPDAKKRFRSRVLRDVARRPVVETGANVPGYSGGAERLSERLFLGCESPVSYSPTRTSALPGQVWKPGPAYPASGK